MMNTDLKDLLRFHVKRVPNCCKREQFDEWKSFASQQKPSYTSWFCTDCTPEFQLKHKKKQTCDHPYVKFKRIDGSLDGYIPSDWMEHHKKTIKRLSNDYETRKNQYDSGGRKLYGAEVLLQLPVVSTNDERQVDTHKE
jgi:hypothetical protein